MYHFYHADHNGGMPCSLISKFCVVREWGMLNFDPIIMVWEIIMMGTKLVHCDVDQKAVTVILGICSRSTYGNGRQLHCIEFNSHFPMDGKNLRLVLDG